MTEKVLYWKTSTSPALQPLLISINYASNKFDVDWNIDPPDQPKRFFPKRTTKPNHPKTDITIKRDFGQ